MIDYLRQLIRNQSVGDPLSLRVNFSWAIIGNLFYVLSQWAILSVLAKLGTPETVGQYALGLAITAPIVMFSNLQLREVYATDARNEYDFRDYFGLRIVMTSVALLLLAGLVLLSDYDVMTKSIIALMSLSKAVESLSDIVYGLLQKHERMDRVAKSLILKGFFSLLVIALALLTLGDIRWGLLGLSLGWMFLFVGFDIRNALKIIDGRTSQSSRTDYGLLSPRFRWATIKYLVWQTIPLGVVMLLISLRANIPRYFLQAYYGERIVGIYSALAYIQVAGTQMIHALGRASSPRLAHHYSRGEFQAFSRMLGKLVGGTLLISLVAIGIALAFGRPLLNILYSREYGEYADVFVLMMLAAATVFLGTLLTYAMTAVRRLSIQAPSYLLVTLATAIVGLILIPKYGLFGAAWGLLISGLLQTFAGVAVVGYSVYSATHKTVKGRIG